MLAASAAVVRPLLGAGRGTRISAREIEFEDSLTGRKISRLTNKDVVSHLPVYYNRVLARRGTFRLIASEVSGARLAPRDRAFFYLQGSELRQASSRGGGDSLVYRCEEGWVPTGDLNLSTDGRYATLIEMREDDWVADEEELCWKKPHCRLRLVAVARRHCARVARPRQRRRAGEH